MRPSPPAIGASFPEPHRPLASIVSQFRSGDIKANAGKAPKSSIRTRGTSSDSPSLHQKPPQPPCTNKRNGGITGLFTGLVKVMCGSENVTKQGAQLNGEIGRPMVKSEGETLRAKGEKRKRNKMKAASTKTNAS